MRRLTQRFPLLLLISACTGSLCLAGTAVENWKLESDVDGVKVYSRAIEGSEFRQVKAIASVNAPMEVVVDILTDFEGYSDWMNDITDSQVIEETSESVHYVYTFEDTPWPVQDRYCVSRMTLSREDGHAVLEFESVPRFMKSRRDAIEFASYKGYWKVDRNKSGCDIEYLVESDPGGHVPSWLANQIAYGGPSKTIHNLRSVAENRVRP